MKAFIKFMKSKAKKLLTLVLAVVVLFGLLVTAAPITAYAVMPSSAAGQPYDGVNFTELTAPANKIYYGRYNHAYDIPDGNYGQVGTREGANTPILWRIMGEEGTDGKITLLSEYVLDTYNFDDTINRGGNYYNDSDIRAWLNNSNAGGFLSSFSAAEQGGAAATNVVTGMYNFQTGEPITGPYAVQDGDSNYNYAESLPWTANGDKVYLPWGKYDDGMVYWTSGNDPALGLLSDFEGKLKSGTPAFYWLRSPISDSSRQVLLADDDVYNVGALNNHHLAGVRPVFKMNPSSVIFASEIKVSANASQGETAADSTDYAAAANGAKNFKLTVVNTALTLSDLKANGAGVTASTTLSVGLGDSADLTGAAGGATKLTYKIVNSSRAIVGYGQGAGTALTVSATDLSGANLADGDYTVYVWAQQDNAIFSHEGSTPQYFTLKVLPVVNAKAPVITTQPAGAVYTEGDTATALTVTAASQDSGVLSYQWYSNDTNDTITPTEVGTGSASYIPPTATVGTTYYYCVVTNTNSNATGATTKTAASGIAEVTVRAATGPLKPGQGDVNDGVDFTELTKQANKIYHGAYDHAMSLAGTTSGTAEKEGEPRPVLWRIMGEEGTDDKITLLSEYVLDTYNFHGTQNAGENYYNNSAILAWLNGTFLGSFSAAERGGAAETGVVTGMYDYNTGGPITESYTTTGDKYAYTANPLPWTATGGKVYLPWGKRSGAAVYWASGNDPDSGKLSSTKTDNIGKLKSGTAVFYWLRSPSSSWSNAALYVDATGDIVSTYVNLAMGVRPVFKMDPSTVIFASEIKASPDTAKGETAADSANYAAGTTGKNFKLTVLNTALTLNSLQANGEAVTPSTALDVAPGGSAGLTGAAGGDATKLTYKIVNSSRAIVGYGQSDSTALTVSAKNLSGANLVDGSYTVYVWAQKDNSIYSNEGSKPQYFTLNVTSVVNAKEPAIGTHPAGAAYTEGGTAAALTVAATSKDGGVLSYKWYSNDTNDTIAPTEVGTDSTSYTPSTATVGTTYYYCVVTNTNNSVNGTNTAAATSNIVEVTVSAAPFDPDNSVTIGNDRTNLGGDASGAGWSWDAGTKTLTLTGDLTDEIKIASETAEITIHIADDVNVSKITKTGNGALRITGETGKTLTVSDTNGPAISAAGDIYIGSGTVQADVTGTGDTEPAIKAGGSLTITGTAIVFASNSGTGADSGAIASGNDAVVSGGASVVAESNGSGAAVSAGGNLTIDGNAYVTAEGKGANSGGTKSGGNTAVSTTGGVNITATGTADAINAAGGVEITDGANTIKALGTGYAVNAGNGNGTISITGGQTEITGPGDGTNPYPPAMSGADTAVTVNGQTIFGNPATLDNPVTPDTPDNGGDESGSGSGTGGGGCDAGTGAVTLAFPASALLWKRRRAK